jgi:epoxyqueuosine reductase
VNSLPQKIRERAHDLGFVQVAFVPATRAVHADSHFEWISEGRHGLMAWIERYGELRCDPAVLEPGTETVVVLSSIYNPGSDLLGGGLRIARYAQGDDYHEVLRSRMLELAAFIHAEAGVEVGARPAVDSAPLLERDLAAAAGIGWIGKNAMLIHPQIGSYTFLSELLVKLELVEQVEPKPDRCGSCSRCIDACPTGAIVSPYVIDARRCISYLTIELRGPIPRDLRPLIGNLIFGCDICQDVCPWNRKAEETTDKAFMTRPILETLRPEDLLEFDQTTFSTVFSRSPIKRAKRSGLLRNAAVVLGNRRDPNLFELFKKRLKLEPDALVRGHVAWALGQCGHVNVRDELVSALSAETEPFVMEEIRHALESACG